MKLQGFHPGHNENLPENHPLRNVYALFLSACVRPSTPPAIGTVTEPVSPIPTLVSQMKQTAQIPLPGGMENLIEKAKEDLACRLSIPTTQIHLVDARAVTWPNASLGCPQPGMQYAEVLIPGYLVIISAVGKRFEYHAGKSTEIFLCEDPEPPAPGAPGDI